jgi:hypothetical protein
MASELILLDKVVTKRDGRLVEVENLSRRKPDGFDSFDSGNAGMTLSSYQSSVFEGDNTIDDLTRAYPRLQIQDFEKRSFSTFTLSGFRFTNTTAARFNKLTLKVGADTISTDSSLPSAISVSSTDGFPDAGHLFTAQRQLIEYTSKSAGVFFGYVVSGPANISDGDDMILFSVEA